MAKLYKISLDELIEFDVDLQEVEEMIEKSDDKLNEKVKILAIDGVKLKCQRVEEKN